MRYPRAATERLAEANPAVARLLRDMTLKSLMAAQVRLMILARMTATERVVSFFLELSERNDDESCVELPMGRCDIGDYLGVTRNSVPCVVRSKAPRRNRGLPAFGYAARPFRSGSH
jgi:CRP-like cAMP-binding protein